MTFQPSYAKLLADPEFGTIKKRKEHAKQMYLAALHESLRICEENTNCREMLRQAIAEESK